MSHAGAQVSRTDATGSIKNTPGHGSQGLSEMNTAQVLRPLPIVARPGRTRAQQLSELIGVIYDAAIDPSLWEYAIERAAYFVGGAGAAPFCKEVGAGHRTSAHHLG